MTTDVLVLHVQQKKTNLEYLMVEVDSDPQMIYVADTAVTREESTGVIGELLLEKGILDARIAHETVIGKAPWVPALRIELAIRDVISRVVNLVRGERHDQGG